MYDWIWCQKAAVTSISKAKDDDAEEKAFLDDGDDDEDKKDEELNSDNDNKNKNENDYKGKNQKKKKRYNLWKNWSISWRLSH